MNEIRIGVVGIGGIAQLHVQSIQLQQAIYGTVNGKVKWIISVDVNEKVAKESAEKYGFEQYSTDWRDALNCNLDLIIIATPNAFHYEVAKAAIENHINVFCEKPLSNDVKKAEELNELAKKNGVVNYVGYVYVTSPLQQYIKSIVDSGKLGKLVRVRGTFDHDGKLDPNAPLVWRMAKKEYMGGALGDTCSHVLSALALMLGDVTRVCAIQNTVIKERPLNDGSGKMGKVEADDITDFLVEYENGVIGTLGCSSLAGGHPIGIDYEIQGLNGSVKVTQDSLRTAYVWLKGDDEKGFHKVILGPNDSVSNGRMWGSYDDMMVFEFNKVFSVLTHHEAYICDFEFGLKIDRIVDAIQQSADTHQWVDVVK